MPTAEELTVAIRAEGVSETQDQLEGVEKSMEETAQAAGDSAEQLQGFAERFQGALGAAIAALSVGAAGLLASVPVLGEAFSGLAAIVRALAFQIDGVLRPVLTPLTMLFYEWANAIYEADGILGGIIGTVSTIVSLAAVLIPAIAAVGSQLGVWASTGAGVVAILTKIGGVIASVAGAIASLPAVLIVAAAALLAFAAAYLTNWKGTRDATNRIVGQIINFIVNGFNTLATEGIKLVKGFVSDVTTWFSNLGSELADWASGLGSRAYNWGKNLISSFIDGIRSILSRVRNFLGDLQDIGANVGISVPDLGGGLGGGGGTSGGGGGVRFRGSSSSGGATYLDGRNMTESTGRYRSDPGRRRGL